MARFPGHSDYVSKRRSVSASIRLVPAMGVVLSLTIFWVYYFWYSRDVNYKNRKHFPMISEAAMDNKGSNISFRIGFVLTSVLFVAFYGLFWISMKNHMELLHSRGIENLKTSKIRKILKFLLAFGSITGISMLCMSLGSIDWTPSMHLWFLKFSFHALSSSVLFGGNIAIMGCMMLLQKSLMRERILCNSHATAVYRARALVVSVFAVAFVGSSFFGGGNLFGGNFQDYIPLLPAMEAWIARNFTEQERLSLRGLGELIAVVCMAVVQGSWIFELRSIAKTLGNTEAALTESVTAVLLEDRSIDDSAIDP